MSGKNQEEQMLIVVSISEGRNFLKRNNWKLVVEGRLDGETISTDEVPHEDNPNFNTELAWEVNRRGFRLFRMQRIPVKLNCYAIDPNKKIKEFLGYIILDLRLVQPKPQISKWYLLLKPKYYSMKPAIRLCLSLEKDTGGELLQSNPSLPIILPRSSPMPKPEQKLDVDVNILQPKLNEEEGYYQIGPETANDIFTLSVTIVFAANLGQLTPSDIHLPDNHEGFYFYYSLLSNDVTTDTFPDLLEPSFDAERATVRCRSSVEFLQQFFNLQPGVKIHLCSGDISLGHTEVPLMNLLPKNSTEIFMKPVSIEGTFELKAPDDYLSKDLAENLRPFIGLSVSLRMEDRQPKTVIQEPSVLNFSPSEQIASPPKSPPQQATNSKQSIRYPQSPPVKLGTSTETKRSHSSKSLHSKSDLVAAETKRSHSSKSLPSKSNSMAAVDSGRDPTFPNIVHDGSNEVLQTEMRLGAGKDDYSEKASLHHFCFTLDMRYIRFTAAENNFLCFLRYSYPFFGTSTAIVTHPLMEVSKNVEVPIPHGFCAFTFAASTDQTARALKSLPLHVEVVRRDRQRNEDVIIGMMSLNLGQLLESGKSRVVTEGNKTGLRQALAAQIPIHSLEDRIKPIGYSQVVMGLDDFGKTILPPEIVSRQLNNFESDDLDAKIESDEIGVDNVHLSTENLVQSYLESSSLFPEKTVTRTREKFAPPQSSVSQLEISETQRQMALETALELEQWKRMQEDHFRKELKAKENYYMESLVNEWRKRDTEREVVFTRKLTECKELENKLRLALSDADRREKVLRANEIEVHQKRADFERMHKQHQSEVKSGYVRLREDFDHKLLLEREKNQEVENERNKQDAQIRDLQKKLDAKILEFEKYREDQRNHPELRLQSEFHLLTVEKVELERKLEVATKSKVHYKQQWGRCLRELARIKQKLEEEARAQLYRQQQELESMRIQYLESEGKSDKKALQEIQGELNRIKEQVSVSVTNPTDDIENVHPLPTARSARRISFFDSEEFDSDTGLTPTESDEMTRLLKERETLLKTGVYVESDRIIRELDRKIDEIKGPRHLRL